MIDLLEELYQQRSVLEAKIKEESYQMVKVCQNCGKTLKNPAARFHAYCSKCSCPIGRESCQGCLYGCPVMIGDYCDDIICSVGDNPGNDTVCEICGHKFDLLEEDPECGAVLERYEIHTAYGSGDEFEREELIHYCCSHCYERGIKPLFIKLEKSLKPIAFSKKFKKLSQNIFSTIRMKNHDYQWGQIRNVALRGNRLIGKVSILSCRERKLSQIPDNILVKDCETKTRAEAIAFLKKFYPDLTEDSTVFYLVLKWEKEATK